MQDPEKKESSSSDEDTAKRRMPEFIDLEGKKIPRETFFEHGPFRMEDDLVRQAPFHLRLICLLCSVVSILWTIGGILVTIATAVIAALFLFQSKYLQELLSYYWRCVKRGTVISIGLILAVFSPYLGLTMVFTYFILIQQPMDEGIMLRIMQTFFKDYIRPDQGS